MFPGKLEAPRLLYTLCLVIYRPHDMSYVVQVISAGRSDRVQPMQQLLGTPTVWYVPHDQVDEYRSAGAEYVVAGGGLIESRNLALRLAHLEDMASVQVSDDLQVVKFYDGVNERREKSFRWALKYMFAGLRKTGCMLAGCAPNDNKLNYKVPYQLKNFIVGDLIVVLPSTPRFDTNMTLKEDYDFTCQHIAAYGGALRCAGLMPRFLHRENPGGAVAYRTSEEEQKNIAYLHEKWPKAFVKHKKPDEIIMRWRYD